jgi:rod shape-determining protein MreD
VSRAQALAVGKVLLLFVIGALLQTLIISRVRVLGVGADLFLIMTVIVAVVRGSMWGAIFGFVAGLAADITYLQPLGVRSLVYVVTGYVLGMLVARFGAESLWMILLYAGAASAAVQVVFGLFEYVMGPRDGLFTVMGVQLLPEVVLDALVAVPVYVLLLRLRVLVPSRGEPLGAARGGE